MSKDMVKRIFIVLTSVFCSILFTATHCPATILQADKVIVLKNEKRMILMMNGEIVKCYKVALGRGPSGPKTCLGDCKTPEGIYILNHRNGHSRFYRSIHVTYPNRTDIVNARKNGYKPGGDIMIHGLPDGFEELNEAHAEVNWTKGCIAVSNNEMDEIWRLVPDGTPIVIVP
jgi:murein L,D-transpeptidase YafK